MHNSLTTPIPSGSTAAPLLRNGRFTERVRKYQRGDATSHHSFSVDQVNLATPHEITLCIDRQVKALHCAYQLNEIPCIKEHLRVVNTVLENNGIAHFQFESAEFRKKKIFSRLYFPFSLVFYSLDFIIHRVLPKLSLTRNGYLRLTRGKKKVYSTAEVLGCAVFCGFEILEYNYQDNIVVVRARKVKNPIEGEKPSYGPIFKMRRVGKNGKYIYVYKVRTMHPYAEYLQEFVFKTNQLADGGKFHQDFRVTTWGKFLRKTWIDELPMIWNWLKGDMKLIGVRPLSEHYLSLYPDKVKFARFGVKPGLIPPFYVDMPKTIEEVVNSELKYIEKYNKNKIKTDIEYFWKSFKNIVIKGARSQ